MPAAAHHSSGRSNLNRRLLHFIKALTGAGNRALPYVDWQSENYNWAGMPCDRRAGPAALSPRNWARLSRPTRIATPANLCIAVVAGSW
jgi:hypothetical protein